MACCLQHAHERNAVRNNLSVRFDSDIVRWELVNHFGHQSAPRSKWKQWNRKCAIEEQHLVKIQSIMLPWWRGMCQKQLVCQLWLRYCQVRVVKSFWSSASIPLILQQMDAPSPARDANPGHTYFPRGELSETTYLSDLTQILSGESC